MPREKKPPKKTNGNGTQLGFEATLWAAADKLRNNMDAAEYNRSDLHHDAAATID
jgi:type I restriction enzyme M protein